MKSCGNCVYRDLLITEEPVWNANIVSIGRKTKMKILTKKRYEEIQEIVAEQQMKIEMLEAENKQLSKDLKDLQDFCINFAAANTRFGNAYNLDFPNSSKSYEDKLF